MKKFGLIGEKLGHSYSPLIHSKFGDYEYELCEAKEEELEALLKKEEYGGFNITIPYKKTVLKLCDEISNTARAIGSVNTIIRSEDGKLKGYNTDYDGFIYLLKAAKIDVKGMKCMVLGSGGASLTVQTVLADMGASEIVIISRKGENNYENINRHFDSEIIVNTTPVGMYPGNGRTPVNLDDFKNCRGVVDLIYNPNKTKLVLDAMAKSLPATGGLAMLVAQAKESSEFFQNKKIEDEEIENAIDEVRSETLNAILIGMPGAGKTLLGKEIADRMGREFVDIDDMIVEHEGMSIPEIFEKKGESYFRKVETEMLEQACVKTGLVIATGGGIVKKKLNYNIIKQNGVVIWIKRDLDKLETDGRPLSQSMPLDQMYEERKDAYSYWSDFFINNNEERE
ncbi:shikimate kinase [Emergencia timonensis]|uniref:shikimate kinase n=1 Tax=Emergencia timonensis TaxID=1776384 RepID=UPI003992C793